MLNKDLGRVKRDKGGINSGEDFIKVRHFKGDKRFHN
jgi:hypothetical protein